MNIRETEIGSVIETEKVIAFFGNNKSNADTIETQFPTLKFNFIKQTHGDNIIEAQNDVVEADAHWTKATNLALCIQTADCIPVLIYCHKLKIVAAVHAGWRGVENQIVRKTLRKLDSNSTSVLIGPHIQMESFEVENNIRDQILKTIKDISGCYQNSVSGKSLVDLNQVIKNQILEEGISAENIFIQRIDTKMNLNYHSFRRDQKASGRQVSFIALVQ